MQPVLVDTDAGTDDALALFILLKAHQSPNHAIKIVGITTVNGNTSVDNVVRNVTQVLMAAGELGKIPIYSGASTPIVESFTHQVEPYHGADGFGDVAENELEPVNAVIEEEHAVTAMIRLAKEFKGTLSILALGPLTNLALAVRMDPAIKTTLKNIYCMGGNIEGEGNATISAEFNFAIDPEAAFITLSVFECELVIIPWEVCKRARATKAWRLNVLGSITTPQAALMNLIEGKILQKTDSEDWIPCDQLAAAVLVNPKVAISSKSMHCTVELQGRNTRGLLVLDHMGLRKMKDNVRIITEFDKELALGLMIWAMK